MYIYVGTYLTFSGKTEYSLVSSYPALFGVCSIPKGMNNKKKNLRTFKKGMSDDGDGVRDGTKRSRRANSQSAGTTI
jgi:hypothetical protein